MNNGLSDSEVRRARLQCHVAAAVFAGCGLGVALAPIEMAPAVRWVVVGFNGMLAIAIVLYARHVGTKP